MTASIIAGYDTRLLQEPENPLNLLLSAVAFTVLL
jgi:hypothetical protein